LWNFCLTLVPIELKVFFFRFEWEKKRVYCISKPNMFFDIYVQHVVIHIQRHKLVGREFYFINIVLILVMRSKYYSFCWWDSCRTLRKREIEATKILSSGARQNFSKYVSIRDKDKCPFSQGIKKLLLCFW